MAPGVSARLGRQTLIVVAQLIAVALLLEIGLRVALPFSGGLRALLYLPTVRTEFDEIGTTEELLARSVEGFAPGKELEGFLRNSRGFRTPEYEYAREPGVSRVAIMGDSFASDSGQVPWRSMWGTLLGDRLETLLDRDIEIVNLGVPAVGPRFVLRLWELEGRRLDPDLVIFSFFVGNDFTDEFDGPLTTLDTDALARLSLVARLVRNGRRLWHERQAAQLHRPRETTSDPARMGVEVGEQREPPGPYLSEETYLRVEASRLKICDPRGDYFESRFAAVAPILERFDAAVRLAGARLVVLIIPDEFQVDPKLLARLAPGRGAVDLDLPQRRLREFLTERDIAHLDLLPVFREVGRSRVLYRERDTHWNSAGNRVAADELARFLTEQRLVP